MPTFNPLVARLSPPPVPSVAAWARDYDGGHGPLIDLSQAVPGYPPQADMLTWLGEAASSREAAGYGPIEGEASLRAAYATHVAELYGAPLAARHVQITAGCNQAFAAAVIALVQAGDTVLMTNPYYFNHETTLSMLGINVDLVPCDAADRFVPDIETIEASLHPRVRALALVSPNNPTGAVYPADRLADIYDLCRRKGIWLILDETYRDFLDDTTKPPHEIFSREGWQSHFVSLYSFSKSYCIPGHRIGAITGGVQMIQQIAKVMDNLQICAPRVGQMALVKAIPSLATWRDENRREIGRRRAAMQAVMAGLQGWKLESIGAYFAYVRHPYPDISAEFVAAKLAALAGVVCLPGDYFGEIQEGFLRFAFANADVETIGLLRRRLEDFKLPGI
ncbi:aspartate/tyrosine/aromatic aminotransferase [Rhizobium sp. Leaf384]|uniref:aminotransferase n=1 Tax=unclassified Rhizobium TaxID=2613769 RepID=UPI000712366F|nr:MULTISPECIES: aminotransferase [unclassified Rhizobium]KQS77038.1 aspartate/tyrosine/aromatic aminotransferase [Rhizobium sp. Leaf384]KQS78309.1 aspartate/tyrosine/aromatic aminotransferase [Rhizobium sp. Leaf383]